MQFSLTSNSAHFCIHLSIFHAQSHTAITCLFFFFSLQSILQDTVYIHSSKSVSGKVPGHKDVFIYANKALQHFLPAFGLCWLSVSQAIPGKALEVGMLQEPFPAGSLPAANLLWRLTASDHRHRLLGASWPEHPGIVLATFNLELQTFLSFLKLGAYRNLITSDVSAQAEWSSVTTS